MASQQQMNPAERFEDEKRRIIDSCFSKREDDGSVSESYITHIRVKEDANYPSSPPPPDSPTDSKKDRVIIVAVRRAGRVRMHKARENTNGSFSIGKTWMLDHLSAIESFTSSQPRSPEESLRAQWAGDTGMLITIQKPYFWKATSSKEKDFFIGSLVKIHRKYAGRDPQLSGFTPQEMATFTGSMGPKPSIRVPASNVPGRGPAPSPGIGTSGPPGPPGQPGPGGPGGMHRPSPDTPSTRSERFVSVSSTGSNRTNFGRQDAMRGFPDEPEQRRFDNRRNGSPAASTISDTSYGGSTFISERDPRQESFNPFDNHHPRSPLPPGSVPMGREGSDLPPLNEVVQPTPPRHGTPGPPPVINPRSPDRRPPRDATSLPPGSMPPPGRPDTGGAPDRMRPPVMNMPPGPGEGNRSFPGGPPPRNDLRQRNESVASNLSASSKSDKSRPSTSGRQGSPQRPPALNISPDNRRQDFLRPTYAELSAAPPLSATSGPVLVPDALPNSPEHNAGIKSPSDRAPIVRPSPNEQIRSPAQEAPQEQPGKQDNTQAQSVSDIASKLALLSPTESASPSTPTSPEENFRPGLGPMIKSKKDVASKFRKAALKATVIGTFTPRPGGAGDRIHQNQEKQGDTADGINGVFVPLKSPLPVNASADTEKSIEPLSPVAASKAISPPSTPGRAPAAEISKPEPALPKAATPPQPNVSSADSHQKEPSKPQETKAEEIKPKQPSPEEVRKKQLSNHATKYAKALNVNPVLLEGRTVDIEAIFDDIGWAEGKPLKRTFADLQAEIKRELSRVETGSWLDAFEGTDDRVVAVSTMLDKTIAECEELDGLLTLYNVELGTLNDDIQYIENQSQGLQVQTANQRQLALELQNLLKTISIPSSKLAALRDGSLSKPDSLGVVEDALSELYKALITIDPNLPRLERPSLAERRSLDGPLGGGIGNMQAVQDKRTAYVREATDFVVRLRQYLEVKYKDAEAQIRNTLARNQTSLPPDVKLDVEAWHSGRKMLWMYSPVMLFARNIVPSEWEELISMYGNTVKSTYRTEIRKSIDGWKLLARRPTGQEQEALFTTPQEKEAEGMARKLTVKRSKTLREGPRVAPGDRSKQEGKIPAYQAFYSALLEICKAIFIEQNFVIKLFHATSTDTTEFPDLVSSTSPENRQGDANLTDAGAPEFGGPFGPRIKQQMANIFYSFSTDLQGLVDVIIDQNPLHLVGVMYALEDNRDKTQHTNQDFLLENLNRVHDDLERKYIRFVDEQMSAIDATKVKISKRKGVIPFMKVFPLYATSMEDMLPSPAADGAEIRAKVNADYQKIYRAMSKALIEVGNKDQDAGVGGGDEEKEQLNHHILLIENHNHYIEEVDVRNNPVLIQGREESERTMAQHMSDYMDNVIRRPLGQLLSAVESAEAAIAAADADGQAPSSIATLASHRANTFRKSVSAFDAKEIRKGVELLRKRVEKHFGDADDERISSKLVEKVTRECEQRYCDLLERLQRIARDVYEGQVDIELKKEDITAAFQK